MMPLGCSQHYVSNVAGCCPWKIQVTILACKREAENNRDPVRCRRDETEFRPKQSLVDMIRKGCFTQNSRVASFK